MLCTRNNTDGNKLEIFSSMALYHGDTSILSRFAYSLKHPHGNSLAGQTLPARESGPQDYHGKTFSHGPDIGVAPVSNLTVTLRCSARPSYKFGQYHRKSNGKILHVCHGHAS